MFGYGFQSLAQLISPADVAWSDVVQSMEAAFSDPKHVIILGVIAGSIVVLYVNYRVARWLERKK